MMNAINASRNLSNMRFGLLDNEQKKLTATVGALGVPTGAIIGGSVAGYSITGFDQQPMSTTQQVQTVAKDIGIGVVAGAGLFTGLALVSCLVFNGMKKVLGAH